MIGKKNDFWSDENCDVIILDNRDSFVYNIAHRLFEVGVQARVIRSDEISVEALAELNPRGLILSPGPGHPNDAGCSIEAVRFFNGKIPILGICLGHQAIACAFGSEVVRSERPRHGKLSGVSYSADPLFDNMTDAKVGRYHSLIVSRPLSAPLIEIARSTDDDFIMGLRVENKQTWGVQFHPESILTQDGITLFRNFSNLLADPK